MKNWQKGLISGLVILIIINIYEFITIWNSYKGLCPLPGGGFGLNSCDSLYNRTGYIKEFYSFTTPTLIVVVVIVSVIIGLIFDYAHRKKS